MTLKPFKIPSEDINSIFSEARLRSTVVVVSIIGKTALDDVPKVDIPNVFDDIDDLILALGSQKNVFADMDQFESFFDPDENVVYLSLIGPSDNAKEKFSSDPHLKEKIEQKGFLSCWTNAQIAYARALLFMFSFSHIILFTNPGYSLNVKTIQLFKVLSFVRAKYQGLVAKALGKSREMTGEWANHGRLCAPRLIFLFKGCPYDIATESNKYSKIAKMKKLEHSLEDLIYMSLRQSRIVKDMCNRALFSIAPNDEFVFVGLNMAKSSSSYQFKQFFDKIEPLNSVKIKSRGNTQNSSSNPETSKEQSVLAEFSFESHETSMPSIRISDAASLEKMESGSAALSADSLSDYDSDEPSSDEESFEVGESSQTSRHSLKELVLRHIRKAHSEGFSDNMGKFSNVRPFFEVPTLRTWLIAANTVLNNADTGLKQINSISILLEKLLGTELKFSNARCKKVLPLALAVYQDSLPAHYNQVTHEKQLKRAIAALTHHARGPAQHKFIVQLKDECDRIWKNGRQTCEALSLNKNSCTKPKHSSQSSTGDSDHWSGVQFYSSCNCGAKQGPRQDPFTLRAANYDYYQIVGQECGCIHSDRVNFPVFQPSTSDFREADLSNPSQTTDTVSSNIQEVQNEMQELHLASPSLSTGKAWNANESVHGSEAVMSLPLSTIYYDHTNNLAMNYYQTHSHGEKQLVRQASTTEYLPGMIHLESPAGLLPQFPSWSLLCRGPSSLYSHNLGLHDCPGFIPGSSYLLPWDVTFREKDMCKSDSSELMKKTCSNNAVQILKPGNRRNQRPAKEFMSVKIFIGIEYECVRGHRFMSSAPGVILKAAGSYLSGSSIKDDAHKITEGNMPLFLPCPCGKVIAQLMRIHIVTPKAPVFVTIDPKVRPAPPPCPTFVTGETKPIPLSQSSYWVLRLPYVYASERKVYNMPTRIKNLKFGELLGPMYGITQLD